MIVKLQNGNYKLHYSKKNKRKQFFILRNIIKLYYNYYYLLHTYIYKKILKYFVQTPLKFYWICHY